MKSVQLGKIVKTRKIQFFVQVWDKRTHISAWMQSNNPLSLTKMALMLVTNRCLVLDVKQESVTSSYINNFSYLLSIKGHFCSNGIKTACDPGFYCGGESLTIQSECTAGYQCPNSISKEICSTGYFSNAKATRCSQCLAGTKAGYQKDTLIFHLTSIWKPHWVWKSWN